MDSSVVVSVPRFWVVAISGLCVLSAIGVGISLAKRRSLYIRARGLGVIIGSALLATVTLVLVTTPVASYLGDFAGIGATSEHTKCVGWLAADVILSVVFSLVAFSRLFGVYFRMGLSKTMLVLNDAAATTHHPTLRINMESARTLACRYSVEGQVALLTQEPPTALNVVQRFGRLSDEEDAEFSPVVRLKQQPWAPLPKDMAWFLQNRLTLGSPRWRTSRIFLPLSILLVSVSIISGAAYDTGDECERMIVAAGGSLHLVLMPVFAFSSISVWLWIYRLQRGHKTRLAWLYDRPLVLWELALHWGASVVSGAVVFIASVASDPSFKGLVIGTAWFVRLFCVFTIITSVFMPAYMAYKHDTAFLVEPTAEEKKNKRTDKAYTGWQAAKRKLARAVDKSPEPVLELDNSGEQHTLGFDDGEEVGLLITTGALEISEEEEQVVLEVQEEEEKKHESALLSSDDEEPPPLPPPPPPPSPSRPFTTHSVQDANNVLALEASRRALRMFVLRGNTGCKGLALAERFWKMCAGTDFRKGTPLVLKEGAWAQEDVALDIDLVFRAVTVFVDFVSGFAAMPIRNQMDASYIQPALHFMNVLHALPAKEGMLAVQFRKDAAIEAVERLYAGVLDMWLRDGTWRMFRDSEEYAYVLEHL